MTPTVNKSEWFTCTSDKPYDRHYYTVNGKRFDDYEQLRAWWFEQMKVHNMTVNVHDYTHSKGFK